MPQPAPGTPVTVTTTYLHLPSYGDFRPAFSQSSDIEVIEAHEPLTAFYRFLYTAIGRHYYWLDRCAWSDERLYEWLSHSAISLLVIYLRGTPAGYIELNADADEPGTEIAYFGLIPHFHGRGLGKHLLSVGVQHAFETGAARVWLHTCTLDGPYALANYQARGFQPYRSTTGEMVLPSYNEV
jgi:ribosomal protein S18 acetylase RimI-like enzyme